MDPFTDITTIKQGDSALISEQKKQMNEDVVIVMEPFYPDGIKCICGKKVKYFKKHLDSKKHREYVEKNNIHIEIEKKPKKKNKPNVTLGRPKKYVGETPEQKKDRHRKYMLNYYDDKEDKRLAHNRLVAKFREENLELCRERVRKCRARKKELAKLEEDKLYKGN